MKSCKKCCLTKPFSDFRKKSKILDGHSNICKDCQKALDKEFHSRNREARVESMKASYEKIKLKSHYKNTYGITLEDYNSMMVEQGCKCAICNVHQDEVNKRFSVDHNHSTGEVRGLLCHNCNTSLGHFKDNVDILESALKYLTERGNYGRT